MSITKNEKHQEMVALVSNHLEILGCGNEINNTESNFDIEISGSDKRIKILKILKNYKRKSEVSIPKYFETEDGVLYMVVSPSDKNHIGYTSTGGTKQKIDGFIKQGDRNKKLDISELGFTGLRKFVFS